MAENAPGEILRALGRLTTGQFVLTAAHDQKRAGLMAQSAQACATDPPLVCVACRKGHPIGPIIRDSRRFGLCQIDPPDRITARRFAFEGAERGDPFDAVVVERLRGTCPILKRSALALECDVFRRIDLECECELYIGLVVAARVAVRA